MTTALTSPARPAGPEEAAPGTPDIPGRPAGPVRPHRPEKALSPWGVVVIWAALLGILVATSAGFGNNPLVLEVSGSSAGFVLLLAGAVWLDRRLRPSRGYLRQPTRVGGAIMLAVTAMVAWLGFAFGEWLLMIAVLPLLAAIGLEILARRHASDESRTAAAVVPAPPPAGAAALAAPAADARGTEGTAGHAGREPELSGSR